MAKVQIKYAYHPELDKIGTSEWVEPDVARRLINEGRATAVDRAEPKAAKRTASKRTEPAPQPAAPRPHIAAFGAPAPTDDKPAGPARDQ
jgi:hypothetical protein